MRTEWIIEKKEETWQSPKWKPGGYNWSMCAYNLHQFFPKLRYGKRARLKITKTRHSRSIKLELSARYSGSGVRVYHQAPNELWAYLTVSSTKRLKRLFLQLRRGVTVIVYVSITPID